MDAMTFTLRLVELIIWPFIIVFGLITLKKPLTLLIPLASRLKYKELEVEFSQDLKAIKHEAKCAFPEMTQDRKALLIASADELPNATILEAWEEVDAAAIELLHRQGKQVDLNSPTRYKHLEETLIKESLIDTKKAKLFSELRQLRNKVAHAVNYEIGAAESIQYTELCYKLIEYFAAIDSDSEQSNEPPFNDNELSS